VINDPQLKHYTKIAYVKQALGTARYVSPKLNVSRETAGHNGNISIDGTYLAAFVFLYCQLVFV